MKRPWQIWTLYAICLAGLFPAVVALTVRTLQLEQNREQAQAEAELARRRQEVQERVAVALWRMDGTLTPLIAQEIARPSSVYQSFLTNSLAAGAKGQPARLASPLLVSSAKYVLLYFEITANNQWSSPQCPAPRDTQLAERLGISRERTELYSSRLNQLRAEVRFDQLREELPDSLLPPAEGPGWIAVTADPPAAGRRAMPASGPSPDLLPDVAGRAAQQILDSPLPAATPQQMVATSEPQDAAKRGQFEFERRNAGVQNSAQTQRSQIFSNALTVPESATLREGVSRPLWLGSNLILGRRVVTEDGGVRVQGCWLDWPSIHALLREEIADLFPEAVLVPVSSTRDVPPGRLLATLPVRLDVPEVTREVAAGARQSGGGEILSATELSLVLAWVFLLLAAVGSAVVLRSVMVLSERRATFVSAVTHELRNPLTTFRMYAEMLAQDMVRDESRRRLYLETLRAEADRLCHLVDNVLQYARLERGKPRGEGRDVDLRELNECCAQRARDRALQANMEVVVELSAHDETVCVRTDPSAVEQIVFNLVDNACKYATTATDRRIHIQWRVGRRVVKMRVSDHGPGLGRLPRRTLFQPFSKSDQEAAHSAPGVGLGLALSYRLARELGGWLTCAPGAGATFVLELPQTSAASLAVGRTGHTPDRN